MADFELPDIVLKELERLQVSWKIEPGKKHGKLYVNGILCGVVPRDPSNRSGRYAQNLRSQVRRAAVGRKDRKDR